MKRLRSAMTLSILFHCVEVILLSLIISHAQEAIDLIDFKSYIRLVNYALLLCGISGAGTVTGLMMWKNTEKKLFAPMSCFVHSLLFFLTTSVILFVISPPVHRATLCLLKYFFPA